MQELSSMYSELGISKEVLEYGKKIEEKLKKEPKSYTYIIAVIGDSCYAET